jgi:acetyltransferase-like isoleucine patch superfamily enzyme
MVGAGATVIQYVSICQECVVGAGAVVIKDISEPGIYVGNPARKVR